MEPALALREITLNGAISGVEDISSRTEEGQSFTIVQFAIGTPVDRAVNDVRNAVAQARSNLPEGILEPQVQRFDTSGAPIMFMAVQATDMVSTS